MAEAHRLGIVHRDLKPSNLFLAVEGDQRTLKVLDFGISKLTADVDVKMTATNSVLGTPLYMSPEQVRSAKNVDARTDIWSLGVILYEMLSGQLPFMGESATAVAASIVADDVIPLAPRCSDLPPGLADVIMKALSKKPATRYQDIGELVAALQPFDGRARSHVTSVIRVTAGSSYDVSPDAQTISTTPPPAGVPPGAGKTAPGWSGGPSVPAPARAGARRAILAGVLVVGVLGVAGTLRSRWPHDALPAGPRDEALSTSRPALAPLPPPVAEDTPLAGPSATAIAPLVSAAPTTSATAKSPPVTPWEAPRPPVSPTARSPRALPAPQPTAQPRPPAPPPVGLPSHI
jgi:hypothetical protein